MKLLLAVFLLAQAGRLQPGTGIVSGSVKVAGGGSAAGIRVGAVAIDDPSGANMVSLGETDSAGRYRLSNIPAGRYYIVAGLVQSPTYYPGSPLRDAAKEVQVEPARVTSAIDFSVPAGSKRAASGSTPRMADSATEVFTVNRIRAERNIETKLRMMLEFEKSYPKSKMLPDVYPQLIEAYIVQGNLAAALRYGDLALKQNPNSVTALIQVSRTRALLQGDLRAALDVAQKAVASADRMKKQPSDGSMSAAEWSQWTSALEQGARSNLDWVRQRVNWEQAAMLKAITRKK